MNLLIRVYSIPSSVYLLTLFIMPGSPSVCCFQPWQGTPSLLQTWVRSGELHTRVGPVKGRLWTTKEEVNRQSFNLFHEKADTWGKKVPQNWLKRTSFMVICHNNRYFCPGNINEMPYRQKGQEVAKFKSNAILRLQQFCVMFSRALSIMKTRRTLFNK